MSDLEVQSIYKSGYYKWLDTLKIVKFENPSGYEYLAEKVREYREWVSSLAKTDDLPEVPKI